MKDDIAGVGSESTGPTWEVLEGWVRERAQALIQSVLEEEVTELLGREKSERKRAVDTAAECRNRYGKPWRFDSRPDGPGAPFPQTRGRGPLPPGRRAGLRPDPWTVEGGGSGAWLV